jgi:hypothetical protein
MRNSPYYLINFFIRIPIFHKLVEKSKAFFDIKMEEVTKKRTLYTINSIIYINMV